MKRLAILFLLVFLTGCNSINLCFKETPIVIQNTTGDITTYRMEGNLVAVPCPKKISNSTKYIECLDAEGRKWACPEGSRCEQANVDGFNMVRCVND